MSIDLDIKVGTILPTVTKEIFRERLVRYAGAACDFSPIHYDDEHARSAGLSGVIAHGHLTLAFLNEAVSNWIGDPGQLKELTARFVNTAKLGDIVTVTGTVVGIEDTAAGRLARVELTCTNQAGLRILDQASALVSLAPSAARQG